jgi:hypothetical protein
MLPTGVYKNYPIPNGNSENVNQICTLWHMRESYDRNHLSKYRTYCCDICRVCQYFLDSLRKVATHHYSIRIEYMLDLLPEGIGYLLATVARGLPKKNWPKPFCNQKT